MINLHLYDTRNHLFLTAWYLPPAAALHRLVRMPLPDVVEPPDVGRPIEELLATALNRTAQRVLQMPYETGRGPRPPPTVPFETWVLGGPSSSAGQLSEWFRSEPPGVAYRVFIHRMPTSHAGYETPHIFEAMYTYIEDQQKMPLARRMSPMSALRAGRELLEDCLIAYRQAPGEIWRVMDRAGHPYWHADSVDASDG